MGIIKNHPAAFLFFLGFEITGIAALLVVSPLAYGDFVGLCGLAFVIGCAVILAAMITGIVRTFRTEKNGEKPRKGWYKKELAVEYSSATPFETVYWIIVCLLTPITAFLLVPVLDYYTMGALLITTGITVFLPCIRKDAAQKWFLRAKNTRQYFDLSSGENKELIDSLCGDYVHAYMEHNWDDDAMDFIYNLLRRENALNGNIRCFRVSGDFLHEKYGCWKNEQIKGYVLVPFSQFELNPKNGQKLRSYLNRHSSTTLTTLIISAFGEKKSLSSVDYAHHAAGEELCSLSTDISGFGRTGADVYFALSSASGRDDMSKRYHRCLLAVRGAQADSADAGEIEARLSGTDRYYLSGFSYSPEEHILCLTVIIDDDIDAENWDMSEEDYDPSHTLVYHCDRLDWYYDHYLDVSKTMQVIEKITKKPNNTGPEQAI